MSGVAGDPMTEQQKFRIQRLAWNCECALRAEQAALSLGDLEWAADRAEAAAHWSRLAVMSAASLTDRAMQAEYQGANDGR